jgi:hypothetical protein
MADVGAPLDRFDEVETGEAFTQNSRLLKVEPAETSKIGFLGQGWVLAQPSEGRIVSQR